MHAPFSSHTPAHNMPAETHIKPKLAVKLDEAELWQEPPVLRRERLHVGGVAEIRLLERATVALYQCQSSKNTHAGATHLSSCKLRARTDSLAYHRLLCRTMALRHYTARCGLRLRERVPSEFATSGEGGSNSILCPNGDNPVAHDQKGDNSPK